MAQLSVYLEGDGAFPDLKDEVQRGKFIHLGDRDTIRMAVLEGGMQSGRPSIVLAFRLPDGQLVMAETSLRLMQTALAAITAKFGDVT